MKSPNETVNSKKKKGNNRTCDTKQFRSDRKVNGTSGEMQMTRERFLYFSGNY